MMLSSSSCSLSPHNDASEGPTVAVGFGDNYFSQMGAGYPTTTSTGVVSYDLSSTSPSSSRPPWVEEDDELVSVSCTITSTYFLTKSGKIWNCGTLHGTIRKSLTRTIVTLPLKCVQIATGRHFCLARMEGGLAVCAWGAAHFGQLGLGNECPPFVDQPTVVESLLPHVVGSPVVSVAAGYWHSLASTQAGQVYAWGANRNSQCGVKPSSEPPTITIPQLVRFDHLDSSIRIEKITAGRSHSVVLDQNGQVYAFGANQYAQCGALTRRKGGIAPPKHVEALTRVRIVGISAGDAHTLALTGGGRIFSFGAGGEGQLGIGIVVPLNPKPKLVGDLDFVAIEAGREWKSKQQGNYATNSIEQTTDTTTPTTPGPEILASIPKIVHITAKGNSSFALSSTGQVYSWGCNDCCNLGIPKPSPSMLDYIDAGMPPPKTSTSRQLQAYSFDSSHNLVLPRRIEALKDLKVTQIAAAPTFLWCIGTKRQTYDHPDVGRTLYEIQESKRQESLQRIHYAKTTSSTQVDASNSNFNPLASPLSPSSQLDPPEMKNGSQVDAAAANKDIGSMASISGEIKAEIDLETDQQQSFQSNKDDIEACATTGESTEHSYSNYTLSHEPSNSTAASATAVSIASLSSTTSITPSRKKLLFSPKKLVKAIVRRASGNPGKSASELQSQKPFEDDK